MTAVVSARGQVKIQGTGSGGSIEVDGVDVSNAVQGCTVTLRAGKPPQVELDALVVEVALDADSSTVVLPEETRALLVRLGWTPPET